MRTFPIILAAVGAISLLAASPRAKADWDSNWHPGWHEHAWRGHEWRDHEWREHNNMWGYNNSHRYGNGYYNYSYGYAPRY